MTHSIFFFFFENMNEQDNKSLQRDAYRTEIPLKSRYSHTTSLKKIYIQDRRLKRTDRENIT